MLSRLAGFVGMLASFLAAFVVYEGAVYLACAASGTGVGSFTAPIMTRIFLINAASFGGLIAVRALGCARALDASRRRLTPSGTPEINLGGGV
jgi:hypothetical protein